LEIASFNALGDTPAMTDLLAPEAWRYRTFGDVDPELDAPVSQWGFDADGDGVSTIWEYATGTNPRLSSSVTPPSVRIINDGAADYLEMMVPRQARRSVQISGWVSTNLITWDTGEPHVTVAADEAGHLLYQSTTPITSSPRQFIRAEVADP
jgi:hypothetical protein